jgi:serine/threonine protein phosphatase 1
MALSSPPLKAMTESLVVIPDIHGRLDRLKNLSGTLCLLGYDERPWVFLGDYIDRGPDSVGVLDYLMALRKEHFNWIFLRGNHEQMMLDYLALGNLQWFHEANGGRQTVDSYERFYRCEFKKRNDFVKVVDSHRHLEFLLNTKLYHQTEDYFFSHAPIPKEEYRSTELVTPPGKVFPATLCYWSYPGSTDEAEFAFVHPERFAVCGHVHQLNRGKATARLYDHICYLDAGCGCHPQAPLAALVLPEKKIVYSLV